MTGNQLLLLVEWWILSRPVQCFFEHAERLFCPVEWAVTMKTYLKDGTATHFSQRQKDLQFINLECPKHFAANMILICNCHYSVGINLQAHRNWKLLKGWFDSFELVDKCFRGPSYQRFYEHWSLLSSVFKAVNLIKCWPSMWILEL